MNSPLSIAFVAGFLGAAGVASLSMAFRPAPVRTTRSAVIVTGSTRLLLGAVLAGFVVLALTRWPVAAVAVGVFVGSWRWLFSVSDTKRDRATIEAVAQWLEQLRYVVRRSSVAIESAVELVAEDTSGVLAEPMANFLLRRRQGWRLPDALRELADDVGHPTADAAVAAIVLVVGGGAGGGRMHDTLDELAMAARDEMRARDEIDRTRRIFQRAMRRLVILTVLFVAGLVAFAADLLAPYRSLPGQIWLLVPCGLWALCLVALRSLTRYDLGTRYRLRLPDEVTS
jgi:Flp pilus assembly protein TadB